MPVAERGTILTTWVHQKWRRASHRRWSGEEKRADTINKALISLRKLEGKRRIHKVGREDIDSGA